MSLVTILIVIGALIALFFWAGKNTGRVAAILIIGVVVIIGFKAHDAPKTVASGGNPLAPIIKMLPASADTSVLDTKVNGVGFKGALKDGGVSKSMGKGAEGFNL